MRALTLLALLALVLPVAAEDQPTAADTVDRRFDKLALVDHPEQHYALYLPAGARERPFPLLVVLDPRGRAIPGLELFLPIAERLGYIVASSYESRSDEGSEVNTAAVPALFEDLQKRMVIDNRRIYIAGYSGTARTAWTFANLLGEHAAGVIASCGGLPYDEEPRRPSFAYFGSTGELDFNYGEMVRLNDDFARLGAVHRLLITPDEHSWAPPQEMQRALLWFELQAMKKELRPRDPAIVHELFTADLEVAEKAGSVLAQYEAFEQMQRDFAGFEDLKSIEARLAKLEKNPKLHTERKERERLLRLEDGYRLRIAEWRRAFLERELPLPLSRSLALLLVPSLRHDAEDRDRKGKASPHALSAQRRLRTAFGETSHYLPVRLEAGGQLRHMAASYEIAGEIRPESTRVFLARARAELRIGREAEARKAFARALELGYDDFEAIAKDEILSKLSAGRIDSLPRDNGG